MNLFRLTIFGVFGIAIVLGVLFFAGVIPAPGGSGPAGVAGTVELWGTIPERTLRRPLEELNKANEDVFQIEYTAKNPGTFDTELVEALASGVGPDMILLPNDLIIRHADKVVPIPYENMTARTFRDTYIEASEIYLQNDGILALPFTIDPLVMYWNRDMYSGAGIANPPTAWEQMFALAEAITSEDESRNITQSALPFGAFDNVTHAKDIIAMLTIQAGDPIIQNGQQGFSATYGERVGATTPPAQSALRFFTEFGDPAKSVYSWNRSLPEARDMFTAGDLATYFGYASEEEELRARSPHLNFDAALMPQTESSEGRSTIARLTGIAVLKRSQNITTAFHAAFTMAGRDFIQTLSDVTGLPPVRRGLLDGSPDNPVEQIFHQSALLSRTWLDPQPAATNEIFREAVNDVVSGRATVQTAVSRAAGKIQSLLGQ